MTFWRIISTVLVAICLEFIENWSICVLLPANYENKLPPHYREGKQFWWVIASAKRNQKKGPFGQKCQLSIAIVVWGTSRWIEDWSFWQLLFRQNMQMKSIPRMRCNAHINVLIWLWCKIRNLCMLKNRASRIGMKIRVPLLKSMGKNLRVKRPEKSRHECILCEDTTQIDQYITRRESTKNRPKTILLLAIQPNWPHFRTQSSRVRLTFPRKVWLYCSFHLFPDAFSHYTFSKEGRKGALVKKVPIKAERSVRGRASHSMEWAFCGRKCY